MTSSSWRRVGRLRAIARRVSASRRKGACTSGKYVLAAASIETQVVRKGR